ncbi:kinase-like protein [Rhizophagus irregularis]|uniref:Kinase-like protein n=1 Tax=Rhizophagus irregularis TaxID=588596 RepID=A0A2N0Q2L7_9GLOM|nr:kinase-like protein [Rhizophagus irregularis]
MKLIHKDLHSGNILIDGVTLISDFGFCIPTNKTSSDSNVYGVMPYMAPEILRGEQHTLASDVYSLGIIMNEIVTVTPPFNNQPHDHFLVLDICRGLRPNTIRTETTETSNSLNFLKELNKLIERCWDANSINRPTSGEICDIFLNILNDYTNQKQAEEQKNPSYNFDETIDNTLNSSITMETHSQAIYKSKILDLPSHLPEPTNCPNQQEFVSSRIIIQNVQAGKFIFIYFYLFV